MGEACQRFVIALGDSVWFGPSAEAAERSLANNLVQHLRPFLAAGAQVLLTHGAQPRGTQQTARLATDLEPTADGFLSALTQALGSERSVVAWQGRVLVSDARPLHRGRTAAARALYGPDCAEPLELLEVASLHALLEAGALVVTGGGNVPVVREGDGWRRAQGIADPDLVAALLAEAIDADALLFVTDVPSVFEEFGTPHEMPIGAIRVDELRNRLAEGHFGPGTIAPKVEACVRFVSCPGRRAAIGDGSNLGGALAGTAGTRVVHALPPPRFEPAVTPSD